MIEVILNRLFQVFGFLNGWVELMLKKLLLLVFSCLMVIWLVVGLSGMVCLVFCKVVVWIQLKKVCGMFCQISSNVSSRYSGSSMQRVLWVRLIQKLFSCCVEWWLMLCVRVISMQRLIVVLMKFCIVRLIIWLKQFSEVLLLQVCQLVLVMKLIVVLNVSVYFRFGRCCGFSGRLFCSMRIENSRIRLVRLNVSSVRVQVFQFCLFVGLMLNR